MSMSWKPVVVFVVLVSGVVLMSACGSGSPVAGSTTAMPTATATETEEPSPTAVPGDYCALVSESEAATATGESITDTYDENFPPSYYVCDYLSSKKAEAASLIYRVFPFVSMMYP